MSAMMSRSASVRRVDAGVIAQNTRMGSHPHDTAAIALVHEYHRACRAKTVTHLHTAIALIVVPVVMTIIQTHIVSIAEALIGTAVPAFVIRYTLNAAAALMVARAVVVLSAYIAPLPSLATLNATQRALFGLPYSPVAHANGTAQQRNAPMNAAQSSPPRHSTYEAPKFVANIASPVRSTIFSAHMNEHKAEMKESTPPRLQVDSAADGDHLSPYHHQQQHRIINNDRTLDAFINTYQSAKQTLNTNSHTILARPDFVESFPPLSPSRPSTAHNAQHTPPYAASTRTSHAAATALPAPTSPSKIAVEDEFADGACANAAQTLYREMRIAHRMDSWCNNARRWIHQSLLSAIVAELNTNRRDLHRLAAAALNAQAHLLRDEEKKLLYDMTVGARDREPFAIEYLIQKYPGRPECERRRALNTYLNLSERGSPQSAHPLQLSYVEHRLAQLSESADLMSYAWNRGGAVNGVTWNKSMPTDAAIIMHAIITLVSFVVPNFIADFYVDISVAPINVTTTPPHHTGSKRTTPFKIIQTRPSSLPPYYFILETGSANDDNTAETASSKHSSKSRHISEARSREWRCAPGRQNVLECLVLMTLFIDERMGGRINGLDINDRQLAQIGSILR